MITVVGSLNMDLVVNTDKIPRPGETVMGKNFKQVPGGKGGNQASAAARLGAKVKMIGAVGQDSMGMTLKASLETDGVEIENIVELPKVATGIAVIIVEASGNNCITVAPGANYQLTTTDIEEKAQIIQESNILLLQLETTVETVKEALKEGRKAGIKTILNPAPAALLDEEILQLVDILTPNETELEVLSEMDTDTVENIEKAAKSLLKKGIKEIITTLGDKGCMYVTEEKSVLFKAYKVKAIDTTAAGDCFNGALAVCLDQGESVETAIDFAMKAGAMSVTNEGAQTSLPKLEEIEKFDKWIGGQNS